MEPWMIFVIIVIILLAGVLWFVCLTPYPFVLLLRSKKETPREKGPDGIADIKASLHIELACPYPSASPNHTFDLYHDPSRSPKRVLIWIHGGSFIAGTSAGAKNFASLIAKEETLVCAMNYAYAPRYHFPTQLKQVDEMLSYLPEVLKQLPCSNNLPVFIGGDSAGANLAAMFTCMKTNPELCQKAGIKLMSDQEIMGNLLFCGSYDFCEDMENEAFKQFAKFFHYIGWAYLGHRNWKQREEKLLASPYHHMTTKMPPLYLCDGKKFSFLWQGKKLVERAKQMRIDVNSRFYETMPHEFQFDYQAYPIEANEVLQDSIEFLNTHTPSSLG